MCDNGCTCVRAFTAVPLLRKSGRDGRAAGRGARALVSKDAHVVRACENAECLVSSRQFLADISRRHAYRARDQRS